MTRPLILTDTHGMFDYQAAFPFVIGQGRNIEQRIYQRRYPAFNYGATVPVVTEGDPWAIGTMFFTADNAGEIKFISGAATDIPYTQVMLDQGVHDFAMLGGGWEWNIEEVAQAAMYNRDLGGEKATATSDNMERKLNEIAMIGATEKNWTGFANNPTVSRVDVDNDGTGASTFWSAKTAQQIVRDVNELFSAVRSTTKEIEWADTLRLPPDAWRYIATTEYGTGNGLMTVLEFLRRNNVYTAETGQPLDIAPLRELATASQDGGGRMVVYRKDVDVIRFHLPLPKRVLQPRQKSLMGYDQGIISRTGGVEVRLPGAMAYGDEITAPPA